MGSFAQRYVKRHPIVGKRAEIRRFCRLSSPNFAHRFHAEILGWRAGGILARPDRGRPRCSENPGIGNERISARHLGQSPENMFFNCVRKTVFRCKLVRGFKELICWPTGRGLGSKPPRTPVSLYVPLSKRTQYSPLSLLPNALLISITQAITQAHYCPAKIPEGHPNPLKISMITHGRSENDFN
jgi:hypothetical protein